MITTLRISLLLYLYIKIITCTIQSVPCVRLFTKKGDIGCRSLGKFIILLIK